MTHTVDTLMALAYTYADRHHRYQRYANHKSEYDVRAAKAALHAALTEALQKDVSLIDEGNKTQPVREPLSDEQMIKAIRHLYKNEWIAEQALNVSIDDFRAIERAHGIGGME